MTTTSEHRDLDGPVDQRIFALAPPAWDELQEALNRPPAPNSRTAALLSQSSILDDA